MLPNNLHYRHKQFDIAQFITLTVGHQFTKANHPGSRTAIKLAYSLGTSSRLQHRHAIDSLWITAHHINNIIIRLFYQTGICPAKRKSDGDLHPRFIHLSDQIFRRRNTRARIAIQFIEPGIACAIALTMPLYIRRKDMCMKIDKHRQ